MSRSFILTHRPQSQATAPRRRVLITGAAGNIGSSFAEAHHTRYDLTLMTHPDAETDGIEAYGTMVEGDTADLKRLTELFDGIDTVLHLAADASPEATWDSVMRNNIAGTYNVMVAAVAAGCRRVVFASSIHAVSGYQASIQVHPDDPVSPGDLYGVSKCFGEAMARFVATQRGVSAIAIRIGAFQPLEAARRDNSMGMMNAFVSHRDLNQLICRCIDDESLEFAVVHGLSRNRFNRMDIETARELLGYEPEDDFTQENPELKHLELSERVQPHSEERGQRSGIREELDSSDADNS